MAMTGQHPDILTLAPTMPDPATVDWERASIVYDRPSDELLIYFDRTKRAAASIALDIGDQDFVYARVDPVTGDTIGVQIDGFIAYALGRYPAFVDILTVAEIRGIDDIAAEALRRWARGRSREHADAATIVATIGGMTA